MIMIKKCIGVATAKLSGSTMLANKRNMGLDTIGLLFLAARDDVLHLTSTEKYHQNAMSTHMVCGGICHGNSTWIN